MYDRNLFCNKRCVLRNALSNDIFLKKHCPSDLKKYIRYERPDFYRRVRTDQLGQEMGKKVPTFSQSVSKGKEEKGENFAGLFFPTKKEEHPSFRLPRKDKKIEDFQKKEELRGASSCLSPGPPSCIFYTRLRSSVSSVLRRGLRRHRGGRGGRREKERREQSPSFPIPPLHTRSQSPAPTDRTRSCW